MREVRVNRERGRRCKGARRVWVPSVKDTSGRGGEGGGYRPTTPQATEKKKLHPKTLHIDAKLHDSSGKQKQ